MNSIIIVFSCHIIKPNLIQEAKPKFGQFSSWASSSHVLLGVRLNFHLRWCYFHFVSVFYEDL
jgi:hypothetical protein